MNEDFHQPLVKTGRFKRGWLATKSSWTVLKMDKKIILFPLIGFLLSWPLLVIGFISGIWLQPGHSFNTSPGTHHGLVWQPWVVVWIATGVVLYLIDTFISAAVIAAALKRFRGEKPAFKDGIRAVRQRAGSLVTYSVFYGIIGQIFSFLENRLPFAGQIIAYLTNIVWSVATIFAIPVIVDSPEPIKPIKAVKGSFGIIKQIWGETVTGSLSIGIVFMLLIFLEVMFIPVIIAMATIASVTSNHAAYNIGIPVTIDVILIFLTFVVMNALSGILSAALYYYATTGEAPERFSKELLHQAFTPKKARKIFGKSITF